MKEVDKEIARKCVILNENGEYIDKTYKCSSAFGKCDHCDVFNGVLV